MLYLKTVWDKLLILQRLIFTRMTSFASFDRSGKWLESHVITGLKWIYVLFIHESRLSVSDCFSEGFYGVNDISENTGENMCNCHSHNWEIGSTPAVLLAAPSWLATEYPNGICVDACIAPVIQRLWEKEIPTLGSCCGHNRQPPGIVVNATDDEAREILQLISQVDDREFQVFGWRLTQLAQT